MRKKGLIGRRFVLWRTDIVSQKYKDQFEIERERQIRVVLEEVTVTVTELKDVPDEHSRKKTHKNAGWKAVAENGDVFVMNWTSSEGSYSPNSWSRLPYQSGREKGFWGDGINFYNRQYPSCRCELPDGTPAVPAGVHRCVKHSDQVWLPGDKYGCWKCYLESIEAKPATAA